jgi:hypothetical protein
MNHDDGLLAVAGIVVVELQIEIAVLDSTRRLVGASVMVVVSVVMWCSLARAFLETCERCRGQYS